VPIRWILLLALLAAPLPAENAARIAAELRGTVLDEAECYRVREMTFLRGDARFYLTDGYLIFAKPVEGVRLVAAFYAPDAINDAEILLRPPDRGERASLAAYTGSPNLNEHFRQALFVATDGSLDQWRAELLERPLTRRDPEMGLLVQSRFAGVARNLGQSFQVRLVHDLLNQDPAQGIFYAGITGTRLGNFDLVHDPTAREEMTLGAVSSRPGVAGFDIWTSFETRERARERTIPPVSGKLEDFRIEATVHEDLRLEASTRISWTPARELRGALGFEIAPAMEVTAALLDGQPVEVFRRESLRAMLIGGNGNEPFLIALPEPMQPGRRYELEFRHEGRVIRDAGNSVYFVGARTNWYPARGLDYTTFDLKFRVPSRLHLVATGDLVSDTVNGPWREVHRKAANPVRLAGFNLGEYDSASIRKGGIHVEVFANRRAERALQPEGRTLIIPAPPAYPTRGGLPRRGAQVIALPPPPAPDPRARMKGLAEEISTAMEWMSSQFGPPPLPVLTVSPIPGFFGQGFPGLLYLSTLAFLDESVRPQEVRGADSHTFYSEILYAHEAAHQWWGNLVSSSTYRDDWLQEALANYSALLILERRKGTRALEEVLGDYRDGLAQNTASGQPLESTGPITWGLRLRTGAQPDPWRAITYDKGSWILHMLRRRMGDEPFLKMLRALRERYAYRAINNEEFRELCAEFLPAGIPDRSLIDFFDHWVYGTGLPRLALSHSVKGGVLSLTLRQSGVPEDFSVDVPVEIRVAGRKDPIVRWIKTDAEPVQVTLKLPGPLQKVELAPRSGILALQ
jgi:hypothetical protein